MRILGWLLLWLLALPLQAQIQVREMGDSTAVLSLDERLLNKCYAPQEMSHWCWAASLQTMLRYYGIQISQRKLVHQALGKTEDAPGGIKEVLQVAPLFENELRFYTEDPIDLRHFTQALQQQHPVWIGLNLNGQSHALVLYQIWFKEVGTKLQVWKVALLDPGQPWQPIRMLSWTQMYKNLQSALFVEPK